MTAKKSKTRLDFVTAINNAVPSINDKPAETEEIAPVMPEPVIDKAEDNKQGAEASTPQVTTETENSTKETVEEKPVKEEDHAEVAPKEEEPTDLKPKKKEQSPKKSSSKKKEENKKKVPSFVKQEKGRGMQKSVYLEEDVYQYIQSAVEEYNLKFSYVMNSLLRTAIQVMEEEEE